MRIICLCAVVLAAGCLPATGKGEKVVRVIKGKGSAAASKPFTVKGEMRFVWEGRGVGDISMGQVEKRVKGKWRIAAEPTQGRSRWSFYSANGGTYRVQLARVSGPWKITVYKLPGEILD